MNQEDNRLFGWKKDRWDPNPKLHSILATVPDEVDLSKNCPSIRDQGNEGSCVGHGIGANVTYWLIVLGLYKEWFSVRDIYNGARFVGGYLNEEGAYPDDAVTWLENKGCLLEHFWPYVANGTDMNKAPSSSLDSERAKYPVLDGKRVTGDLSGIYSALATGHPVSIGSPWFDAWMDTDKDGKLSVVTNRSLVAGGHEWCCFGYSKKTGYLGPCMNSWSIGWGKKGFFYVPTSAIKVFKSVQGYDAHIIDVDWKSVEPQPTPAQSIIELRKSTDGERSWTTLYKG